MGLFLAPLVTSTISNPLPHFVASAGLCTLLDVQEIGKQVKVHMFLMLERIMECTFRKLKRCVS